MRLTPSFAAIAMALLLVLTAQSMAVARGMPAVAGAVVLCTGAGPVTILTDAEGQPLGPAHICPDCTLSLILALGQAAPGAAPPSGQAARVLLPAAVRPAARAVHPFRARGPPVPV